jgi:ankyrin repeat protein
MEGRQHDINPATQNTCGWLLRHPMYQKWMDQERGLLWISGNPGAGKSTLLKYAFQHIIKDEHTIQNHTLVLSFFFHGRGNDLQKTRLGFFRSILHQVLHQEPSASSDLLKAFKDNCETKGTPGQKWNWHEEELRNFLRLLLRRILESRSILIFVDALDESGETIAKDLVAEFHFMLDQPSTKSRSTFRICFTCRHYPIIDFKHETKIRVEKENREDIATYVRKRLTDADLDICRMRDTIIERASGIFQWARLVVDEVDVLHQNGETVKSMEERIQHIPNDLSRLYRDLLGHITEVDRPKALKFFEWIAFAIRPLSLDELRIAMAIEPDSQYRSIQEYKEGKMLTGSNDDLERRVKFLSRGLAEVRQHKDVRIIQFIHQSVNDFLVSDGLTILVADQQLIDLAIGSAHYRLSRSCIRVIEMEEFSQEQDKKKEKIENTPFLRYATQFWLLHAERSQARGILLTDLLRYLHGSPDSLIRTWVRVYHTLDRHSRDCPPGKITLLHVVSARALIGPLEDVLGNLRSDNNDNEVDVNARDGMGQTSLMLAARRGNLEVVERLLAAQADVNAAAAPTAPTAPLGYKGRTALQAAAGGGHLEVVERLLAAQADVNAAASLSYRGRTALQAAAGGGHLEVVERLLAAQADVNAAAAAGLKGRTALQAAAGGGHLEVVERLLAAQADVNAAAARFEGRTALQAAAGEGHLEVVERLLAAQADVNAAAAGFEGRTALQAATERGHLEVIKRLRQAGATGPFPK